MNREARALAVRIKRPAAEAYESFAARELPEVGVRWARRCGEMETTG